MNKRTFAVLNSNGNFDYTVLQFMLFITTSTKPIPGFMEVVMYYLEAVALVGAA